jgi:hypothetical protein
MHVFVGPANIAVNHEKARGLVDPRFPRLVQPRFAGLTIDSSSLDFTLTVPAGTGSSNFLGNSFLFTATWHDTAEYFHRALFVVAVS